METTAKVSPNPKTGALSVEETIKHGAFKEPSGLVDGPIDEAPGPILNDIRGQVELERSFNKEADEGMVIYPKMGIESEVSDLLQIGEEELQPPAPPPDPTAGATVDAACTVKAPYGTGKCSLDGNGCLEHVWCPPEGTSTLRTLDMTIAELDPFRIRFDALLSFQSLLPDSAPLEHKIPEMTLTQLLRKVGANEEQVKKTGAVISVQVWWDCNLEMESTLKKCEPKVNFIRLDEKEPGFSWRRATYYYTAKGERARDVQRLIGVRIKMSAYGYGKKPDPLKLILQLAIGLTLLGFSKTLTDFIMLNIMEDRDLYYAYKMEESEDFGDMREKLQNLDKEEQVRLLGEKRRRSEQMKKMKKRR